MLMEANLAIVGLESAPASASVWCGNRPLMPGHRSDAAEDRRFVGAHRADFLEEPRAWRLGPVHSSRASCARAGRLRQPQTTCLMSDAVPIDRVRIGASRRSLVQGAP